MQIAGYILLALGAQICAQNIYASLFRYALYLRKGGKPEDYRHMSPVPLLGSIVVGIGLALVAASGWLLFVGVALIILDFGGLHWMVIGLSAEWLRARRERGR